MGAAAAAAPAGRCPRAWVAEGRRNMVNQGHIQGQCSNSGLRTHVQGLPDNGLLTHALGGHHTGHLGGGGPHGVEGLWPGSRWTHGVGHVLEVWNQKTRERKLGEAACP